MLCNAVIATTIFKSGEEEQTQQVLESCLYKTHKSLHTGYRYVTVILRILSAARSLITL